MGEYTRKFTIIIKEHTANPTIIAVFPMLDGQRMKINHPELIFDS